LLVDFVAADKHEQSLVNQKDGADPSGNFEGSVHVKVISKIALNGKSSGDKETFEHPASVMESCSHVVSGANDHKNE
jgi:hypothetical protein